MEFEQVLTVRQLTLIVEETISYIPSGLVVEGEVQKVRVYKDYMVFFELAGEGQSINCFTTFAELAGELPEEGSAARVVGEIQLGKKTELRFRVRKLDIGASLGNQAQKLEALRHKLRAEGIFDDSRKRDLPRFPKRVAVITSGSSSAWEDFKRVSSSRFLASELELFSATVQGDLAVQEICSALTKIEARKADFDVIAIVRGGGARGDLEAFNSEDIVRAVANSSIPVVSGVGHEDDISLVDLVADERASTPSNAAEIIFPDSKDLLRQIYNLELKARSAVLSQLEYKEMELTSLKLNLKQSVRYLLGNLESRVALGKARLEGLDFEKIFAKGFALLETNGKILSSVKYIKAGEGVTATLSDGKLKLTVKEVNLNN